MNKILQWLLGTPLEQLTGGGDWEFGFVSDYSDYAKFGLILALIALGVLTVRTYRREGDAPRGARIALGVIRMLVFVLILGIIFQPALILKFTKELYSSVVVVVDDSLSMSFNDRYQDGKAAAEAERLGLLLGASADEVRRMSRTEVTRRVLDRPDGVLSRLADDHPVEVFRCSTANPGKDPYTLRLGLIDRVRDKDEVDLAPASGPADRSAILARLKGAGFETNLAMAIRDAIERMQGRRVAGLILISDGQITSRSGGDRLAGTLDFARRSGMAINAVLVGDPTPPKNVAVTGLQAPREVRTGAEVEFTAVVAHRNLVGESVTVELQCRSADGKRWEDTGVKQVVRITANDTPQAEGSRGSQGVKLKYTPPAKKFGEFVYRVVALKRQDEANADDNAAETLVEITEKKTKVLLVAGDSGREFRFLRDFLVRQPDAYGLSVWQQNADKDVTQVASEGMQLRQFPRDLVTLMGGKDKPGYDVIVLLDPFGSAEGFDEVFAQNLATFVKRGHGLCYVAGNKHSEDMLVRNKLYKDLQAILPVSAIS